MTNEAEEMPEDTENTDPDDATAAEQPPAAETADGPAAPSEGDAADSELINFDELNEPDEPDILFAGPDRLGELEAQVADLNDKLLRAVAETENVRRRTSREKEDASKYAIAGFAGDMVSVADNLTRALGAITGETRANDEAVDNLMTGVEMTLRDLLNTFEKSGIKRIEAMDKPFDHNLHEAMFEMEDPARPTGTVVQVLQEGYTIRDRLLRPVKVGVSKGGPPAPVETTGAEQADTGTRENAPEQTKAYEQGKQGPGRRVDEEL